jgi:hypothetical protein
MSLAHVAYKISNDSDFAAQWRRDPKATLTGNGYSLSREELAFLSKGLRRAGFEGGPTLHLSELDVIAGSWRE